MPKTIEQRCAAANIEGVYETVRTFSLEDGRAVEMIDEDTFRIVETGEIIRRVRDELTPAA